MVSPTKCVCRVCEWHFRRQPVAHIYDVENMVHQEGEAVLLTAEGKIS